MGLDSDLFRGKGVGGFFDWLFGKNTNNSGNGPCTDGDGGIVFNSSGTTYNDVANQTDYCNGPNQLIEFYCSNGAVVSTEYNCQCNNGACSSP